MYLALNELYEEDTRKIYIKPFKFFESGFKPQILLENKFNNYEKLLKDIFIENIVDIARAHSITFDYMAEDGLFEAPANVFLEFNLIAHTINEAKWSIEDSRGITPPYSDLSI